MSKEPIQYTASGRVGTRRRSWLPVVLAISFLVVLLLAGTTLWRFFTTEDPIPAEIESTAPVVDSKPAAPKRVPDRPTADEVKENLADALSIASGREKMRREDAKPPKIIKKEKDAKGVEIRVILAETPDHRLEADDIKGANVTLALWPDSDLFNTRIEHPYLLQLPPRNPMGVMEIYGLQQDWQGLYKKYWAAADGVMDSETGFHTLPDEVANFIAARATIAGKILIRRELPWNASDNPPQNIAVPDHIISNDGDFPDFAVNDTILIPYQGRDITATILKALSTRGFIVTPF